MKNIHKYLGIITILIIILLNFKVIILNESNSSYNNVLNNLMQNAVAGDEQGEFYCDQQGQPASPYYWNNECDWQHLWVNDCWWSLQSWHCIEGYFTEGRENPGCEYFNYDDRLTGPGCY